MLELSFNSKKFELTYNSIVRLTFAQDVGVLQVEEQREDFQARLGMFTLQILVSTRFSHF
jgi:hypothetical protein